MKIDAKFEPNRKATLVLEGTDEEIFNVLDYLTQGQENRNFKVDEYPPQGQGLKSEGYQDFPSISERTGDYK